MTNRSLACLAFVVCGVRCFAQFFSASLLDDVRDDKAVFGSYRTNHLLPGGVHGDRATRRFSGGDRVAHFLGSET